MNVQVDRLDVKSDSRGCVWEPLNDTQLPGQRNVHVVITLPGGIRGNHFHKLGTEIATVRGPAMVRFCDDWIEEMTIAEEEVYRFVFPPKVPHAFFNNGKVSNLIVAFNTSLFDPTVPDVFPRTLIEANPDNEQ